MTLPSVMIPLSACPLWQSETPGQAAAGRDGAAAPIPRPGDPGDDRPSASVRLRAVDQCRTYPFAVPITLHGIVYFWLMPAYRLQHHGPSGRWRATILRHTRQ